MHSKQAYRTSGTWVDRPEAPFGPLGWEDNGDSYSALLPFIPGYPVGYNTVAVMPASESDDDKLEYDTGWWFMMFIHTNNDGDVLPVSPVDMGIYVTFPTAEDTMQFIEDHLSPESVSQVLEDMDFLPVRDDNGYWLRASRHATRRAAGLGELDWEKNGDDYVAQLPAIPGYQGSYPNEVRVCSHPKDDDVWLFEMLIGVGDKQVPLYNYDFGIPYGGSADEMMDAVENLDPEDIASVLGDFGFAPEED